MPKIKTGANVLAETALGTQAMIELGFQLTIVAGIPPITTVPGDVPNLWPMMVISVPCGPVEGVRPVMTAGGP
jgi:hypothetical protein